MSFPTADFKALYPAFSEDCSKVIELIAEQALAYVPKKCKGVYQQLWLAATAHMMHLRHDAESGSSKAGAVSSASVGGVSVSFATAPANTSQKAWFSITPYGLEFLALRARCSSPVRYIGGRGQWR